MLRIPEPQTVAERAKIRGCRNCVYMDAPEGMCRHHNVAVSSASWCGFWAWARSPRVTWCSAIAGQELVDHAQRLDLDAELAVPYAPSPLAAPAHFPNSRTIFEYGQPIPPGQEPTWELIGFDQAEGGHCDG